MKKYTGDNPKSTAKVGGHPIHPMLIVFPIAFLVGTFLCDLAYWIDGDPGFAQAALWLLGLGVITALLAALAGFADFLGENRIRRIGDAWQHMIGNLVAVALAIAGLVVRLEAGAEEAVIPVGLLLSTAVVVILVYTGWKGGELVYRHRVGVHPTQEPELADRGANDAMEADPIPTAGVTGEAARGRDEPRPHPH
jgi:uncharacterized membrane protein